MAEMHVVLAQPIFLGWKTHSIIVYVFSCADVNVGFSRKKDTYKNSKLIMSIFFFLRACPQRKCRTALNASLGVLLLFIFVSFDGFLKRQKVKMEQEGDDTSPASQAGFAPSCIHLVQLMHLSYQDALCILLSYLLLLQ